jgi:membrane protein implicated in regulation of membrane protease activity
MHIHIDSTSTGGSQIRTWFTTHVFVRVFLIIWMVVAVCMSITPLVTPIQGNAQLFWVFPLFGILLVVLMRLIARRDEDKLERLVRDVIEAS